MGFLPEVVRIIAAHVNGPRAANAIGTGFFLAVDGKTIHEEGLLLTNAHVVTGSPVIKIMTTYIEHQALPVTVVSVCHDRDLALLKVEPQVLQYLKRTLDVKYGVDHVPALSFADSDALRQGDTVHAVGHPLGMEEQQFTTGKYNGHMHLKSQMGIGSKVEIRGLTSATINGGNSGGPNIIRVEHDTESKQIHGMHYFVPSVYKVVGVNTFKLTGANVDGENGIITANTVQLALPTLLAPLQKRAVREKMIKAMVGKMMASAIQKKATVSALVDHLTDEECGIFVEKLDGMKTAWDMMSIGGMVQGKPRDFHSWLWRHVIAPGKHHLHHGAVPMLSKILQFAKNESWDDILSYKGDRKWSAVRTAEGPKDPKRMPVVVRVLPPAPTHVYSPIVGVESRPIYSADMLVHYKCPLNDKKEWVAAEGGVLVTQVAPRSLYETAGGQPGDVIYGFKSKTVEASFTPGGTWYSAKRDIPMTFADLCNDTPIDETITLSVLRRPGKLLSLSFPHRMPTASELPEIRKVYPFCDEGRAQSKQKMQVQGVVFTPLRLDHVMMFRHLEYMPPSKRYAFKVVIESVSPDSPVYATAALQAGSIVTHINDEPVEDSWDKVQAQLSKPHPDTNCWVIDSTYNGQSFKYAMLARTVKTA